MCEHVLKTVTKRTITYVAFWLKAQKCPKLLCASLIFSRLRYIGRFGWAPPCQHIRRLPCRESCIASRGVRVAEPTAAECQHTCMLATAPWRLRPLVSWWHYQLIAAPMNIGQLTALHSRISARLGCLPESSGHLTTLRTLPRPGPLQRGHLQGH